jgi:hypothetical protein
MTEKVFTTRFKLILYRWNIVDDIGKQLAFDIYDEVDLEGNPVTDPTLATRSVSERDLSTEISDIKTKIKNMMSKLKDLGKLSQHPLPITPPAEIEDSANWYLKEFLKDKYSYYVDDTDLNISWKALDPTTDYKKLSEPHSTYYRNKIGSIIKLFKGLKPSLYDLVGHSVEEIDLTEAVVSIDSYTVSLDQIGIEFKFTLSLEKLRELGCSYITENSVVDFFVDVIDPGIPRSNLHIGEYYGPATKDEVTALKNSVDVLQPNELERYFHQRRFVGIVTAVNYTIEPEQVPTCTVTCKSYSAYLDRVNTVKDRALMTFFENYPLDMQQPGMTVFMDVLNFKTIDEIFEYVLNTLYLTNKKGSAPGPSRGPEIAGVTSETGTIGQKTSETSSYSIVKLSDTETLTAVVPLESMTPQVAGGSESVTGSPDIDALIQDDRLKETKGLLYTSMLSSTKFGVSGLSFYRRAWYNVDDINQLFTAVGKSTGFSNMYWVSYLYFKVREKYRDVLLQLQDDISKKLNEVQNELNRKILELGPENPGVAPIKVDAARRQSVLNTLKDLSRFSKYCYIAAYQEGDSATVRAYSLQVAESHSIFYNVIESGTSLLSGLFETTHAYIFDDEPGTLVLRYPRPNMLLTDENGYVDPDFVVNREDILKMSWSRRDFDLMSRQDFSPIAPLTGEIFPFCWAYTDSQVAFKYGTSVAQKTVNPNVSLFHLNYAALFSAISLSFKNAATRAMTITVVNNGRRYCLGRVYFIPDPYFGTEGAAIVGNRGLTGWVAMLHSVSYSYTLESVPTINLEFIFARRVSGVKTKG